MPGIVISFVFQHHRSHVRRLIYTRHPLVLSKIRRSANRILFSAKSRPRASPPPPRWPEFFFLFSVSLGTLGGFSSKEDLSDTLTESRGSLPFSMIGVKPTDNERSCAEMAKNSDVVRVASDEEAARVISFPVITRCRPTIYFSLHLFPIRPKHAPPFCPLSAFTDR